MNSFEDYQNACRICLDENVALNWNNKLFDDHGVTYKDCYYKYTHLEYLDEDPFSPMLCENCLNILQNIHVLVLTALDSHAYLSEKWLNYCELNETEVNYKSPIIEFETVLVEEVDNERITEQYVHENEELDNSIEENKRKTVKNKEIKEAIKFRNSCIKTENIESSFELEDTSSKMFKIETIEFCESDENIEFDNRNIDEVDNECITEQYVHEHEEHVNSVQENKRKTLKNEDIKKFRNSCLKTENIENSLDLKDTSSPMFKVETIEFCESDENFEFDNENIDEQSWEQQTSNMDIRHETETCYSQDNLLLLLSTAEIETNKKRNKKVQNFVDKVTKKSYICSYCSKVFPKRYLAKQHERTHIGVRERREACNICGLKFFDKKNLYNHLITHRENREKRFKCEFCDKAFYNSGTRNIHRRIHLGQMIPCSLCTKKFFRQVDLERHMNTTHAAQSINMEGKRYNKYYVRCKYCGKSIRSTTYKAHTAAHLKAPLMKCSICDREFYRRSSCTLHMKRKHHKTPENYNDFIICYTKNRISNLYLKQNAELELPQD